MKPSKEFDKTCQEEQKCSERVKCSAVHKVLKINLEFNGTGYKQNLLHAAV